MSDDDFKRLRTLASAATPGLWRQDFGVGVYRQTRLLASLHSAVEPTGHNPDAAYIAAASPDVLLRLLDEHDALRKAALLALDALTANERIYTEPAGFAGKWGSALDRAISEQQVKIDAARAMAQRAITALRDAPGERE